MQPSTQLPGSPSVGQGLCEGLPAGHRQGLGEGSPAVVRCWHQPQPQLQLLPCARSYRKLIAAGKEKGQTALQKAGSQTQTTACIGSTCFPWPCSESYQ